MRRLLQWAFNFGAVVAASLFVAVCVLWAKGRGAGAAIDPIDLPEIGVTWTWWVYPSRDRVWVGSQKYTPPARPAAPPGSGPGYFYFEFHSRNPILSDYEVFGFGLIRPAPYSPFAVRAVGLPFWPPSPRRPPDRFCGPFATNGAGAPVAGGRRSNRLPGGGSKVRGSKSLHVGPSAERETDAKAGRRWSRSFSISFDMS